MNVAAALLTGGASRRMGHDKAGLVVASAGPETLAVRTARLLRVVAHPVVEVGGAATDLPRVADRRHLAGPLAALADAAAALRALSWRGPVLVVATDLPWLTVGLLAWLAHHPGDAPVVPLDAGGRPQPLCARYPWSAMEEAERLVAGGATAMAALLERTGPAWRPRDVWAGPAGRPDALDDVDTPADLEAPGHPPGAVTPVRPPGAVTPVRPPGAVTSVRALAVRADRHLEVPEHLATEEPLEIRAAGPGQATRPVAVTMRTPGHDFDLAAGFLVTEGLIRAEEITGVAYCAEVEPARRWNTVTVALRRTWSDDAGRRAFLATSSCGVCGKATIDDVELRCAVVPPGPQVAAGVLLSLPDRLRRAQRVFDRTGGLHAAGLFGPEGDLRCLREDVGRHNAVDKVVGRQALHPSRHAGAAGGAGQDDRILAVSGRLSFEIVQKAAMAGLGVLVAVSAPSSLAVETARRLGVTVAAFVRDGRMNLYSHPERVDLDR